MGIQERRFKMIDLLFRAGEFESSEMFGEACLKNGICSVDIAKHDVSKLKKLAIIKEIQNGKKFKIKSLLSVHTSNQDYQDLMENYHQLLKEIKKASRELSKIAKFHFKITDDKFNEIIQNGKQMLSQLQFNIDILDIMSVDGRFYRVPAKREDIKDMAYEYDKVKKQILKDLHNAHNDMSYQVVFRKTADNL